MKNFKLIIRFLEQNGYKRVSVDSPYGGYIQFAHRDGRQVACSFTERSEDRAMYGYHPSLYRYVDMDDYDPSMSGWSWCSIRGLLNIETEVVDYLLSNKMGV